MQKFYSYLEIGATRDYYQNNLHIVQHLQVSREKQSEHKVQAIEVVQSTQNADNSNYLTVTDKDQHASTEKQRENKGQANKVV